MMVIFISHLFSPYGRPEASICCVIKAEASRYQRDSLSLKCLAYESLRLVQNSGTLKLDYT